MSPLLARLRWEHLTYRLVHERLPRRHREAGSQALSDANLRSFYVLAKWGALVRRAVYFCQAIHSAQVVKHFFLARSRRRRLAAQTLDLTRQYATEDTAMVPASDTVRAPPRIVKRGRYWGGTRG